MKLLLIVAAFTTLLYYSLHRASGTPAATSDAQPSSWTVPVEVIETGQAPSVRQVVIVAQDMGGTAVEMPAAGRY